MTATRIAQQAVSMSLAALVTLITLAGVAGLADRQYDEALSAAAPAVQQVVTLAPQTPNS